MASISDFLTAEALKKLDTLSIRSRFVVEGSQSGGHRSPLKGASVEFADRREYVKGDNLRNLDWKVFGRTERYYIRQFEEETSLRVMSSSTARPPWRSARPTISRSTSTPAASPHRSATW